MGDNYAETIIRKKMTTGTLFFRIFVVLFATFISVGLYIYLQSLAAILILVVAFLTYIVFRGTELEYEYLYVNGQLDIECIYSKKKRKPAKSFNFDKLEVMAPLKHQKILAYEHRTDLKEFNFTSGYAERDIYVAILVGQTGKLGRLYFEPSQEMVKAMYAHTPSKVFMA